MTNSLTGRQTALIAAIMIFSSKLLVLPSLFYETNKFFGFFCLLFILTLEFLFLFFLIKLKLKHKNINFFNLISKKIGIFLTKTIYLILFVFFLFKLVYVLQESFSFLKESLYTEATVFIFLLCVLPVITAMAFKGLKGFGRTLEIFYLVIIIGIVMSSAMWLTSISNFSFTFLSNNGVNGFLSGIFDYSFWFGDFIFIMLFIDKIQLKKNEVKTIYFHTILAGFILLVFYFAFFYIYQTTSFSHLNAISDIIQFSTNLGIVGKLDLFAITVIMFLLFFESGLFMFCLQECMEKVIHFGHKAQPLIVINTLIILFFYYFFTNATNFIIFYSDYLKYLSLVTVIIIPILFLLLLIKYKPKKIKNKFNN